MPSRPEARRRGRRSPALPAADRPSPGAADSATPASPTPRIPDGTYRLQFGPGFDLRRARGLLPYLRSLGISDLYLSPIFRSRPGSEHGYDVVDPGEIDPELGGAEAFHTLAEAARDGGQGILLDIVPNHMAAAIENPWWCDLLRHGPASPYASYFDIDWFSPGLPGPRLLLGVLGEPYAEALESGALSLEADEEGLWVRYHDRRFPVEPGAWQLVLGPAADGARVELRGPDGPVGPARGALAALREELRRLPSFEETSVESAAERRGRARAARERLRELWAIPEGRAWVGARVEAFADAAAGGMERMDRLLSAQPYTLVHWRLANEEVNYRRFFDIGDMVALRVERPDVFRATHGLVLELVERGLVTGLRIDHVDGLWDPRAYLERLQARLREAVGATAPETAEAVSTEVTRTAAGEPPFYVVVEKILSPGEELPKDWPVHGTTGYDFLAAVQGVFLDPAGLRRLDAWYRGFTGREEGFPDVAYAKKREVMERLFPAEIRSLCRELTGLARRDRQGRDLPREELEACLREVTACLPVYRTYVRETGPPSPRDLRRLDEAFEDAARRAPERDARALAFLRRVLGVDEPPPDAEVAWRRFAMHWQQVTGPVTAKGLEDTSLYVYNRLMSLNEVGSHPDDAPSVHAFHRFNARRLERWPHALNATSTHDTKRSEDVRARLDALSELAAEWDEAVERWSRMNAPHRARVEGREVPDRNEEAHLYQILVGAWPLEAGRADADFRSRLRGYLEKAIREAKVHSSWREPDPAYEGAVADFLEAILREEAFLASLAPLRDRVARLGAANALGQALLTLAAPGVPDCYQGTEMWDFSLVDPDNRRPVDYERRRRALAALDAGAAGGRASLAAELREGWADGHIKLWLTAETLRLRRREPALFRRGAYLPLTAEGPVGRHVCAFARRLEGRWAVAAVPRLAAALPKGPGIGPAAAAWRDTRLRLPPEAPARWAELFSGRPVDALAGGLPLEACFAALPFALLTGSES